MIGQAEAMAGEVEWAQSLARRRIASSLQVGLLSAAGAAVAVVESFTIEGFRWPFLIGAQVIDLAFVYCVLNYFQARRAMGDLGRFDRRLRMGLDNAQRSLGHSR